MTKEILEEIIRVSVETKTPEKVVCKGYGMNPNSLRYFKKKYDIKPNPIGKAPCTARLKRSNDVNDDFFKIPNLLNSYYAGFFAADGNVAKDKKKCSIVLSTKDETWLNRFALDIGFTGNLQRGISKGKYPYISLYFTSETIAKDLNENFNITPQKSLTLQPPNITDTSIIDAFICGYIDGDGSIGLVKNKKAQDSFRISVVGTLEICNWIRKRFSEILNAENVGSLHKKKEHTGNTFIYSVSTKQARQLFEHFYQIRIPKLERKWSLTTHDYCVNYKKKLPICRRKGVRIFDLKGNMVKICETLKEAEEYSGVCFTTISTLCKYDDNKHQGNGYMFSRTKDKMEPYSPGKTISKLFLNQLFEKERDNVSKGEVDVEMADAYSK